MCEDRFHQDDLNLNEMVEISLYLLPPMLKTTLPPTKSAVGKVARTSAVFFHWAASTIRTQRSSGAAESECFSRNSSIFSRPAILTRLCYQNGNSGSTVI